ncbi:MAG TPA: hypothetical protein VHO06_28120 [Polyangia bacterium]|nr:hypothetical protein [Polyangia bacterium]
MRRFGSSRIALLTIAFVALLGRVFLVVNFDRNAGVECIRLRFLTGLDWREYTTSDPPPGEVDLVCGGEWGVTGGDLVAWNGRYGFWYVPLAAVMFALLTRPGAKRRTGDSPARSGKTAGS